MINKLIWFIHGKEVTIKNLLIIHSLSFLLGLLYLYFFIPYKYFSFWQALIFLGVFWETFGGLFANLTLSTKKYWANQSLAFKELYLSVHFLLPVILYLVLGWDLITCILLLTLTLGIVRLAITLPKPINNILSIAFFIILSGCLIWFKGYETETLILGIGYLAKLTLGFSFKWY